MKKVTNGFARLPQTAFNDLLGNILFSISGNKLFPTLQDDIAALQAEANIYFDLSTKAKDGGKVAIIARNEVKEKIVVMLHIMGMHVSAIARGQEEILTRSGFPFTRTRQSTAELTRPRPLIVKGGVNNGELTCKTKKQKGTKAISYLITTTPEDDNSWKKVFYSKTTYTFSKLTSCTRYYIKVGLVGVRGQEVISEPTSYVTQ